MNSECVFCKIVAGTLPAVRVYEDAETLAFLDIAPVVKGHTLVIPRAHYPDLMAIPAPLLERLIGVVQRIAAAQIRGLKAEGINVTQANGRLAGQVIPHIHFHVIPRFPEDGHSFNWKPRKYERQEEMEQFAAGIKAALSGGA